MHNRRYFKWFESYLCNRKQRVVIEGQCSDRRTIKSGILQRSVQGRLLFLIYINDISDVSTLMILPSLLEIVDDPVVSASSHVCHVHIYHACYSSISSS